MQDECHTLTRFEDEKYTISKKTSRNKGLSVSISSVFNFY
jgi:hypothetical protein